MRRSSLRQASRTGDGAACHEQSLLLYYCQHSGLPSLHQIHPVKCCLQSSRLSLSMSSQIFQIPPPNQFQRFLLNHCHINDPASLVLAVFPHWQNVWAKQCKGGDMYLCALSQKCQSITQGRQQLTLTARKQTEQMPALCCIGSYGCGMLNCLFNSCSINENIYIFFQLSGS